MRRGLRVDLPSEVGNRRELAMAEPSGGHQAEAFWCHLPGDVLLLVHARLAACPDAVEADLAAMRATCRSWRLGLAEAPVAVAPLGKPSMLAAFPRATALDYAARGAGQSLTDADLGEACGQLGARLQALDVSGAFQLSAHGVHAALGRCPALRRLAADGSTLQDAAFARLGGPLGGPGGSASTAGAARASLSFAGGRWAPAAPLQRLESLSLRGCLFLRGTLLADLAASCPHLASLDLAGCGLALNLNPEVAALLPRLGSLQRLALDGNGVDDAAMQHIAALPRLRELSVRGSAALGDAGLHHLAQMRGSRSAPAAGQAGSSSSGSGSCGSADVGLRSLDISGCTSLTDQCWLAITEMQGLTSLRMERMNHLLQFPAMPEALPAALWRLPRLRALSLAGSCVHPSKLKLLAATCGGSVAHLDIGVGGSRFGSPSGSPRAATGGSGDSSGGGGMPPWAAAERPAAAEPPGPAFRRLSSLHERDLCEAAQAFRQLQTFSAAGSALPLRVCTAFVAAAPAGRLTHVDLRGCSLASDPPAVAAAHSSSHPWQQQLCFSSGARRALNFDSYPAVAGTSMRVMQQLHAEADSWQRPATGGRFASELRRHAPSLASLRLGGASGVTARHLSSLSALGALTRLDLAGSGDAVSPALLAGVAAGCPRLRQLDLSATAADDACLAEVAALPALRQLSAADCPVGDAGVAALAAGLAAAQLRVLDLFRTGAGDASAAALAAGCRELRALNLTACHQLSPAGVASLCTLPRLACLGLGRCPGALTDASLLRLALFLPRLTWLNLSEAARLSAEGVAAALADLPCLAHLDLTAAAGGSLREDRLLELLAGSSPAARLAGGAGPAGAAVATPANVQLPGGGTSPTGSPFKRRAAPAGAAALPVPV